MSITKRTFLSIGGLFCLVLLALNAATYLLFRQSITRQLITSQEAVTEANVQLSHVFTQTTDKLIYQYTSDTELGELLSRPVGRDELEDLNTKSLLNSRMTYHLNAENLLTNNGFRMELYLDPALPVSGLFTPENTIPNVSRVFSGDTVADTEWYRTVRGSTQGRYVFLDETRQRLCFAFKLQNSTYAGAHRKAGLGVLLGSLPLDRLPNLLSIFPLTEHSGFLLLNRQGRQVFCSENLDGLPMDAALPLSGETSTRLDLGGQRFLGTAANLESGLRLVFLTPYSDITGQVWGMMSPYLLCSAVFLALGVLVALGLSAQVSRPVVQFTRKLEVRPFRISVLKDILGDHNPDYSHEDLLTLYMLTGGVPDYVAALMDAGAFTKKSMLETALSPGSVFLREGNDLMTEEFGKDNKTYLSMLQLIASGRTQRSDIESVLKVSAGEYLQRLEREYGFVTRRLPMLTEDRRLGRWEVTDMYLRFYFRYIQPNDSFVQAGRTDLLMRAVSDDLESYEGRVLEDLLRRRIAEEGTYTSLGGYWNRKGDVEIDIVVLDSIGRRAELIEVKRNPEKLDMRSLERKAETLEPYLKGYDVTLRGMSMDDV